jgi:hypothetical protein
MRITKGVVRCCPGYFASGIGGFHDIEREPVDRDRYERILDVGVREVVKKQPEIGIVDDDENVIARTDC